MLSQERASGSFVSGKGCDERGMVTVVLGSYSMSSETHGYVLKREVSHSTRREYVKEFTVKVAYYSI